MASRTAAGLALVVAAGLCVVGSGADGPAATANYHVLRGAFSAGEAETLRRIAAEFEENGPAALTMHERNFGQEVRVLNPGETNIVGHTVTYLHKHLPDAAPGLWRKLWDVAATADRDAGWGYMGRGDHTLNMRCVESIQYFGSDGGGRSSDLGWHVDQGSILSLSVMLSDADGYEGGAFEMSPDKWGDASATTLSERADKGDVIVWKPWGEHRVTPVTSGHRHVLVMELWWGEANDSDIVGRQTYMEDSWCVDATSLDEDSAMLASFCAIMSLANASAAQEEDDLWAALKYAKKAVALDPKRADAHATLAEARLFYYWPPKNVHGIAPVLDSFQTAHDLYMEMLPEDKIEAGYNGKPVAKQMVFIARQLQSHIKYLMPFEDIPREIFPEWPFLEGYYAGTSYKLNEHLYSTWREL